MLGGGAGATHLARVRSHFGNNTFEKFSIRTRTCYKVEKPKPDETKVSGVRPSGSPQGPSWSSGETWG